MKPAMLITVGVALLGIGVIGGTKRGEDGVKVLKPKDVAGTEPAESNVSFSSNTHTPIRKLKRRNLLVCQQSILSQPNLLATPTNILLDKLKISSEEELSKFRKIFVSIEEWLKDHDLESQPWLWYQSKRWLDCLKSNQLRELLGKLLDIMQETENKAIIYRFLINGRIAWINDLSHSSTTRLLYEIDKFDAILLDQKNGFSLEYLESLYESFSLRLAFPLKICMCPGQFIGFTA